MTSWSIAEAGIEQYARYWEKRKTDPDLLVDNIQAAIEELLKPRRFISANQQNLISNYLK